MCEDLRPIAPTLVFTLGMGVEFDADKEQANREKHGYSLRSVEHWLDAFIWPCGAGPPPSVWLEQPNADDGEERFRILTIDWERHVVDFVFAMREGNLRPISYRRAHRTARDQFYAHHTAAEVAAWCEEAYPSNPDGSR